MKIIAMILLMAAAVFAQDTQPRHDYKGLRLGASRVEVNQQLGEPKDKSATSDLFTFSNGDETVKFVYDAKQRVSSIVIDYMGAEKPSAKSILGVEVTAARDGSVSKLIRYPKAAYWGSYNRTAGDSPIVTVTIQSSPK